MHYVTDISIRLTALAPDGTQFIEEVGINGDQTQARSTGTTSAAGSIN